MEKKPAADSSLLEHAFSLASQKAQTLESLSSALDVEEAALSIYWVMVNKLRRCQGYALPVPTNALLFGDDESNYLPGAWYAPTKYLFELLEIFQVNEALAVHYGHILTEPEGGHFELNLAASEIVLAARLENPALDKKRMERICVQATEPNSGIELLISNAGKILLGIEDYRTQPFTGAFIENLYTRLTEGISIKESCLPKEREPKVSREARSKALESFCEQVWPRGCNDSSAEAGGQPRQGDTPDGERGGHTLIKALTALHFFRTFHLFPAGNPVLAYVMYFLVLHRAGYHFSSHVPVVKLLYAGGTGGIAAQFEQDVVECDGHFDWTRFFECTCELLIEEQRLLIAKLDGIKRRRERLLAIIDADETLNHRQREVLLETALHSNAEFTYAIHVQRYDVSYPCARSDFARLLDVGFLRQHNDGIRHFFVASDKFEQVFFAYLKKHCPQALYRYYDEEGRLHDEHKGCGQTALEYNRDVGFYERSLLDKTYVEHYDFRRAAIAERDGPRREGPAKE